MHHSRSWFITGLVSVATLAGCGKGKVGSVVEPDAKTAAEALGEGAPSFDCTAVAPTAEPLVVDWPDHQRMDLGLALGGEGVAVVKYDCGGLELLKHCKIEDGYKFAGRSVMTGVVELQSADSIQASLPVQGAKFSASVAGDSQINVATAIIGRMTTPVAGPSRDMLTGDAAECERATHYVRAAYVGAFMVETGTKGEVKAAAEIFNAAAGGQSSSQSATLTKDGNLAACEGYMPGPGTSPPGNCQSAVRVELSPLGAAAGEAPKAANPEQEGLQNTCAAGYVPTTNGGCVKQGTTEAAYLCDPKDEAECRAQCDKGHAGSCYNAALRRWEMPVAPNDPRYPEIQREKVPFLERACEGGVGIACQNLGLMYQSKNAKLEDPAKSKAYLEKGCFELLEGAACYTLSHAYEKGTIVKADKLMALQHVVRACDLGYVTGCTTLGKWYMEGHAPAGVKKDGAKAVDVLDTACVKSRNQYACFDLEQYLRKGKHIKKDAAKAAEYHGRGCGIDPGHFECK